MTLSCLPDDIICIIIKLIGAHSPYEDIEGIKSLIALSLICNKFQHLITEKF